MSIHDELQRIATAALDLDNKRAQIVFDELVTPANVLELLGEIHQLRVVTSAVATAVGASLSVEHSTLEFIGRLPGEVSAVLKRLADDHDKQWRRAELFGNNGQVLVDLVLNKHQLLCQLADFIIKNTPTSHVDWGCKQCAPHSEMLGDGTFVCALHQAHAIVKESPTP